MAVAARPFANGRGWRQPHAGRHQHVVCPTLTASFVTVDGSTWFRLVGPKIQYIGHCVLASRKVSALGEMAPEGP
jgi:hypothetical protein